MESLQIKRKSRLGYHELLTAVILISFVFRVYILLNPLQEPVYQMIYGLLYPAMAACALLCARVRRDAFVKLMLLCTLWMLVSCAVRAFDERETYQLSTYFMTVAFSFFVCYPLFLVQEWEDARRAFHAVSVTYMLLILALCCVGLYATVTNTPVSSLAGPGYIPAVYESGRLTLFCYPTVASTFCCLALLNGLYQFARAKRLWAKILCVLAMLILYAALSLTDSRTSCAFFALCFGAFFYVVVDNRLALRRALPRFLAACCAAALAAGLAFFGTRVAAKGVLAYSAAPAPSVSASAADDIGQEIAVSSGKNDPANASAAAKPDVNSAVQREEAAVSDAIPVDNPANAAASSGENDAQSGGSRSLFENLSTLQGRTYAWEGALRALKSEPRLLLFGSSPLLVMDAVSPYITQLFGGADFAHLHSIFFQTLVAYGVPGLLLFNALLCYVLYHALRVFFLGRGRCSIAERTLPLILFFCLAVDLLETFLSFTDVMKHSNPWFFLAAGYVVQLSRTRIPSKLQKAQ